MPTPLVRTKLLSLVDTVLPLDCTIEGAQNTLPGKMTLVKNCTLTATDVRSTEVLEMKNEGTIFPIQAHDTKHDD